MATVLELAAPAEIHLALEGMLASIDGTINEDGIYALAAGQHSLQAFAWPMFGHRKERYLRIVAPPAGLRLANPLEAGHANPWVYLAMPNSPCVEQIEQVGWARPDGGWSSRTRTEARAGKLITLGFCLALAAGCARSPRPRADVPVDTTRTAGKGGATATPKRSAPGQRRRRAGGRSGSEQRLVDVAARRRPAVSARPSRSGSSAKPARRSTRRRRRSTGRRDEARRRAESQVRDREGLPGAGRRGPDAPRVRARAGPRGEGEAAGRGARAQVAADPGRRPACSLQRRPPRLAFRTDIPPDPVAAQRLTTARIHAFAPRESAPAPIVPHRPGSDESLDRGGMA